jgi:predicted RNase H-like nuclease
MSLTSFIGIDLAWKTDGNHSGIAVLEGDIDQVALTALANNITSMQSVVQFIADHSKRDAVIAVDAPLVVINQERQRPCERLIGKTFSTSNASCHSTNMNRRYWDTGSNLIAALAEHEFVHDFDIAAAKQREGRWLFEVYPHPAMIRLFGLKTIILYKNCTVVKKREGLQTLCGHLKSLASGSIGLVTTPILDKLLTEDLQKLRGEALKRYEDTLDAVFCAYLAWHCWRWGVERNEMFGTLAQGYIVVPRAVELSAAR